MTEPELDNAYLAAPRHNLYDGRYNSPFSRFLVIPSGPRHSIVTHQSDRTPEKHPWLEDFRRRVQQAIDFEIDAYDWEQGDVEDLSSCLIRAVLLTLCKPEIPCTSTGSLGYYQFWCELDSTCAYAWEAIEKAKALALRIPAEDWARQT
jgi:hypothetical protein